MNAIVLAGGFGSRLAPLTDETIKPMLKVAGEPMIDYCLKILKKANINDIVFALYHDGDQIEKHIYGEGKESLPLEKNSRLLDLINTPTYHFSYEPEPLGTAGSVKHALHLLHDDFIVISGDCLIDIDLNDMIEVHQKSGAKLTMAVKVSDNAHLYGVVEFDEKGVITDFVEKPQNELNSNEKKFVNCGVYIAKKEILNLVPKNKKFDFSKDLFPLLLKNKQLNVFIFNNYWFDIGSVEQYVSANEFMFKNTLSR
ncbi:MAG: nucleotidyltransferase family protein [Firmicutes bacterium]|nr:nucleotidyltransferase family protein [Bacillota bacterium]